MAKGKLKEDILYRTEKWELMLSTEQEQLMLKISDGLREIYNLFRAEWMEAYGRYREEKKSGQKPQTKLPTLFDQINLLTALGEEDRRHGLWRANIPRNWKEETLDSLHGALKSFFSLVKNGDRDARPPRERSEKYFCAVPGRLGFALRHGRVIFAPNIFGKEALSFPVPQQYQAGMLARASKIKKFVISRDEPNLRRAGRFWLTVSYEIEKPEQNPFVPEEAVYVALGASYVGIVSPRSEEVLKLWRPDKHWKPRADAVEERMKKCVKGSRKWKKLDAARRKALGIMGRQQTLDRREVVARELLSHGVHFVVTDLVVRSKEGKLADHEKLERRGQLGLNWQAQNTGSIGYLAQWLEEKAPEFGGSVQKHKLPFALVPSGEGAENKIAMAKALRDDFLRSQKAVAS